MDIGMQKRTLSTQRWIFKISKKAMGKANTNLYKCRVENIYVLRYLNGVYRNSEHGQEETR